MKIAVPVSHNGQIEDHFGQCAFYSVYSISDSRQIEDVYMISSQSGCGCKSGIAGILAREGVEVMLAGGIGAGAIAVLNAANIEVVRGCSGAADRIVERYLAGEITDSGESCLHHEHHHGHGHGHGAHS